MFGLARHICVTCPSCRSSGSFSTKDSFDLKQTKYFGSDFIKCNCGNEYSIVEGIIQELISDSPFHQWEFISDIYLKGSSIIKVGTTHTIRLEKEVPNFIEVTITLFIKHASVTYKIINPRTIEIISSVNEYDTDTDGSAKLGEEIEIGWNVYGSSNPTNIPTWERLLVNAKTEHMNQQYNLALLTSAMAFESFVDLVLDKLLISKGLTDIASEIILDSMRSIYDKVHKLLPELSGADIKQNKQLNKNWVKGVLEKRNDIAHGETIFINKEESQLAFETVVRLIFFILERTSIKI